MIIISTIDLHVHTHNIYIFILHYIYYIYCIIIHISPYLYVIYRSAEVPQSASVGVSAILRNRFEDAESHGVLARSPRTSSGQQCDDITSTKLTKQ